MIAAIPPAPPGETVQAWVARADRALQAAGVETARLDARLLMASVLGGGVERALAQSRDVLDEAQQVALTSILTRRVAREPMSHILGVREFWSLPFRVTPATLTPRPDSETLIEAVLGRFPDRVAGLRILDLGTGTGCLLISLLHEYPNATGVGLDISEGALAVAKANADALDVATRVTFRQGSWSAAVPKEGVPRFDVVISNPPYIPDDDIADLMPEVAAFEPRTALAGGRDGLDAYRAIVSLLPDCLKDGGAVFIEVGAGQDGDVAGLLAGAGFANPSVRSDSAGIGRCVMADCQGRTS